MQRKKNTSNRPVYLKFSYLLLFMACLNTLLSQDKQPQVLALKDFIQQVKQFHPVAKQATLLADKAEASLLMAKGEFDPLLNVNTSNKTFNSKNYFYYTNPELKIPLPIGNIITGLESNGGELLNSENTKGKSSYFGVELPIARGLITDKRRTALQQAKIYRNLAEQEKLQLLNDLLLDAYNSYWHWAGLYRLNEVYRNFINNAERRLRLVKIGFAQGDRSAMDTIEAATQLQNYRLLEMETRQRYINSALELSNYLWLENDSITSVNEWLIPDTINLQQLKQQKLEEEILAASESRNPELKKYNFKGEILLAEKKLKKQNLLPYVSLKANLLYKNYSLFKTVEPSYWSNNSKWGINFSIPLFLREARGYYKNTLLKIKQNELDYLYKKQQVQTKIKTYFNECTLLRQQLLTTQSMYANYTALLRNEELRFKQGESSLFLLISRETKLLELAQKQIELTLKYQKSVYALDWAGGILE